MQAIVVCHSYDIPGNAVGSTPALDQHIGRSLRCSIGVRRRQHIEFAVLAFGDVTIDLVGADLHKYRLLRFLLCADQFEQVLHTEEIGDAEVLCIGDGRVDVALGSEVEDNVALWQAIQSGDVGLLEAEVRKLLEFLHDGAVGGIAELVDGSDKPALLKTATHEMLANEPKAAGDDKDFRFLHGLPSGWVRNVEV